MSRAQLQECGGPRPLSRSPSSLESPTLRSRLPGPSSRDGREVVCRRPARFSRRFPLRSRPILVSISASAAVFVRSLIGEECALVPKPQCLAKAGRPISAAVSAAAWSFRNDVPLCTIEAVRSSARSSPSEERGSKGRTPKPAGGFKCRSFRQAFLENDSAAAERDIARAVRGDRGHQNILCLRGGRPIGAPRGLRHGMYHTMYHSHGGAEALHSHG